MDLVCGHGNVSAGWLSRVEMKCGVQDGSKRGGKRKERKGKEWRGKGVRGGGGKGGVSWNVRVLHNPFKLEKIMSEELLR